MSRSSWRSRLAGTVACALALAACGPAPSARTPSPRLGTPPATAAPTTTPEWLTYHRDAARSGNDTTEPSFSRMKSAWTAHVDGAVWAEPLVVGTHVIAVTENDSVYALAAGTGDQQWHVSLGAPRTSNFPCGDIMPLGITATPVVDGGWLYVVGEVEPAPGSYEFLLARINPDTGAVAYTTNITPAGMDANVQQQRSALAVSRGNIVVTWGGLDGDCGHYHGYVETASETTGARVAVWQDTAQDVEGGMWAPSGAAVDADGTVYLSTGNGSTSDINAYDDGDSVVQLSPALSLLSFFAPGAPQAWNDLNAEDNDLGSVGPSLLGNGLLIEAGKGGRAYVLRAQQLPNDSNPGGGEAASMQVCHSTHGAAYGGFAVSAAIVYVPCADGIAAVSVSSPASMRVTWYSSAGGGAPILAGGVLWTVAQFGGTTLYGLDPASGAVTQRLTLSATTEHFATPAAGDGRVFLGASSSVFAFAPGGGS
ncbi:MAG TPA: PQQ-binding-like beta-propeller repeat protein [Candidatus Dormibacteraeota bacterium]